MDGKLIIATNLPIREVSPVDQGPKMAGIQHVAFNLAFRFPPSRLAWMIEFGVFNFICIVIFNSPLLAEISWKSFGMLMSSPCSSHIFHHRATIIMFSRNRLIMCYFSSICAKLDTIGHDSLVRSKQKNKQRKLSVDT